MRLRPLRDYVWILPRPELAEETTTLKLTHGELSPEQAKIVAQANTVGFIPLHHLAAFSADYKSHPDSLTFGEVVAIGPGRPELAQGRPGLSVGDLVSYKRNRISRELYDPDKALTYYLVHEHGICLRHPNGAGGMPEPLSDQILTRVDPEGAQKALNREMSLTDEEIAWGIVTRVHEQPGAHRCPTCKQATSRNAKAGSAIGSADRMMVERVVSAGNGRWVKALWDERLFGPRKKWVFVENQVTEGSMIGFSSANDRARFRLHGQVFTVSPWQDFITSFDG